MITITLNNLNLSSGNYSVNTIQHDSGTPLNLNTIEVAREDGVKLISTNYGVKKFTIEGLVKGSTQSALEYNLDTFKKTISGTNLNLDIDYGYGRTRRYVVAVTNIAITREFFNLTFAPYSLEVEVQDPPFGQETSEEEVFSGSAFTNATETFSCVFSGTAEPKPIIEMTMDIVGNLGGFSLKNQTTNTEIDIYTGWANSDIVEIDTVNKTVQKNSQDVEFEGVFPECDLGLNNFQLGLDLANNIDQSQETYNTVYTIASSKMIAQSFQAEASYNTKKIEILAQEIASPSLPLIIRIETNGGSNYPSGTLVNANATKTLTQGAYPSLGWITVDFPASFALVSGTTYWIVISQNDGVGWAKTNSSAYANGKAAVRSAAWADAGGDFAFRVYKDVSNDFSVDTKVKYIRRYL